jgi:ribonuclease D
MQYLTKAEEIRNAIAHYAGAKILWLDTEVADYNTKKPRLSLIQILDNSTDICGKKVVILDVLDKPELIDNFISKIMINPGIEKVFHNARYDLNFLGKRQAKKVTCTLEMVQNIPYYLVPIPNRKLKTLAEQLCHFPPISKEEQGGDWGKRPLSPKQLEYAKMDPVYVAAIHHRLLQLQQLVEPKPETENIAVLTRRYWQIEHQWKQLDTEIKHLKERLKRAMEYQEITAISGFKLSSQKRTTKKVALKELAEAIQTTGLDIDFSVTLTKELQEQLAEIIEQLPVEEETKNIWQLRVAELDDFEEEDIPF